MTLPLELPVRVAEDAAVLDLMCGGRLEVGIGPGGNLSAYDAFGLDSTERMALLVRHHRVLVDAWSGRARSRALAGPWRNWGCSGILGPTNRRASLTVALLRLRGLAGGSDARRLFPPRDRLAEVPERSNGRCSVL